MAGDSQQGVSLIQYEAQFSGKIYSLGIPQNSRLSHEDLKNDLDGVKIPLELEEEETDDVVIPQFFRTEGEDKRGAAEFNRISTFNIRTTSGVVGFVEHDTPSTIEFHGDRVLVLESSQTQFAIFERSGVYYLSIIGRRELVESVTEVIREHIEDFGFRIEPIDISADGFESIFENLVDYLRTTTISGYSNPHIDKKQIIGNGYGNERQYKDEKKRGSVHGQRFGTRKIGLEDGDYTVEISDDGLVRVYNKVPLSEYINMISEYIIPNTNHQIQTTVYSHGSEDTQSLTEQD